MNDNAIRVYDNIESTVIKLPLENGNNLDINECYDETDVNGRVKQTLGKFLRQECQDKLYIYFFDGGKNDGAQKSIYFNYTPIHDPITNNITCAPPDNIQNSGYFYVKKSNCKRDRNLLGRAIDLVTFRKDKSVSNVKTQAAGNRKTKHKNRKKKYRKSKRSKRSRKSKRSNRSRKSKR